MNHTFITLILKKKTPEKVTDYRYISLCNVLYKIIAKVLVNRLKLILPHVISSTQSAFVLVRLIIDNVIVAYELMHFFRQKKTRKEGFMSLKLDISKTYDRVE